MIKYLLMKPGRMSRKHDVLNFFRWKNFCNCSFWYMFVQYWKCYKIHIYSLCISDWLILPIVKEVSVCRNANNVLQWLLKKKSLYENSYPFSFFKGGKSVLVDPGFCLCMKSQCRLKYLRKEIKEITFRSNLFLQKWNLIFLALWIITMSSRV